jgi:hypothetical protein
MIEGTFTIENLTPAEELDETLRQMSLIISAEFMCNFQLRRNDETAAVSIEGVPGQRGSRESENTDVHASFVPGDGC